MCGIAGFSLSERSTIDPWQATRVLLSSVAERGADAAGTAYEFDGRVVVDKQPGGASTFLDVVRVPAEVRELLVHVRDFTKGRPSLMANNHPIRHGQVVGVHNGKIANDELVFADLKRARFESGMTVDSEAIFASLDASGENQAEGLERLNGSLATGWFDERRAGRVFLARGHGRPLWIARTASRDSLLWASTLEALEVVEDFLEIELHKRPVSPGTILEVAGGKVLSTRRFSPDRRAQWLVNPVASPNEKRIAIAQLNADRAQQSSRMSNDDSNVA